MESRHESRARTLYGETPTKPVRKVISLPRKNLYSAGSDTGSIETAVASCFNRIEARHRDDPERLQQVRDTRQRLTRLFEERHVTPADAHTMLAGFYEHEVFKHSPENIAKRWPSQWDAIRRAAGSTEEGEKILANAVKFFSAIKEADPAFAHTATVNGSVEMAAVIQAAANYPDPPTPTKEK